MILHRDVPIHLNFFIYQGNWVPLDEYYYGTMEGDSSYTEEKGEFRFKVNL